MSGSSTLSRTNMALPSENDSIFYMSDEMTPACVIPGLTLAWLKWTSRLVVIIERTLEMRIVLVFKHRTNGRNSLTRTCAATAL